MKLYSRMREAARRGASLRVLLAGGLLVAGAAACSEQIAAAEEGEALEGRFSIVETVTVTPSVDTILVGATTQLTARVTDQRGRDRTRTVSWSSANPTVATVSPSGVVRGVAVGTVKITATSSWRGTTGSATIVVQSATEPEPEPEPQPAPVATVTLSPASASIDTGATRQLAVTLRDANGNVLTGRAVTWISSSPATATVSASGLVKGVAAGNATITATSEGISGQSAITVVAPAPEPPPTEPAPGTGAAANECAAPKSGWIFCDDFDQDRLSKYFEHGNPGAFARTAGVGRDGSSGMRARWSSAGQVDAGHLSLAFGRTPQTYFRPVDAGTAKYREIYFRHYIRNQPGWVGGAGWKMARLVSFTNSSNWGWAMTGFVSGIGQSATKLTLTPERGVDASGVVRTSRPYDPSNTTELGPVTGVTPIFDSNHVGKWYCVEGHIRLNDAGMSNGVFEFWVDGNLEARRADLDWVGSYDAYGINAMHLENYWNNGSPQAQERYFDNLVVSTQRIGC